MRHSALAFLLLSSCAGGGVGAVPRYPWVEDHGLALAREELVLDVERDGSVRVTADFHFAARASWRDRVMTFPVATPRGATRDFRAELMGSRPHALPVAPSEPDRLPVGEAAETWDLWVPGAELERHGGWLRVSYAQPGAGSFAYTLKSGAYWSGPIERLEVVLRDPHARVAALWLEGERVPTRGGPRVQVVLVDVEPDEGVRLELR